MQTVVSEKDPKLGSVRPELVGIRDGYRLWSEQYDEAPNPLLALERRIIGSQLPGLRGTRFLDLATGTGYWLDYAVARGARAFGIDLSSDMLNRAAQKRVDRRRLVLGDLSLLPFRDDGFDIAMCSMAVGYVASLDALFLEFARVSQQVIVSDLHECAIQAGWTRSFEIDGRRYEIEQFPHRTHDLDTAAEDCGLRRSWRSVSYLGEAEREIFVRAGREHAFAAAARVPAILSTCWTR